MSALALHGGEPVRSTMLPYGRQIIDEEDIEAVVKVMRSDWLTTGPSVASFEEDFAARFAVPHAVAVCNGTAALHAAIFAAGIGVGDEVIVPALTFAASANCVRYQGGTVVFADVRSDTLTLDPASVLKAVTPRTRAIVTVDFGGLPSDLKELKAIAEQYSLVLIEDAAHSLGATYRGAPVGSQADITTYSFHPVKHITTGEGGMVVTASEAMARKLRMFRNHGITSDHRQREKEGSWFYEMLELGYNYRLTDMQCALGKSQLKKLAGFLQARADIAREYDEAFASIATLECPTRIADRESAWHLYVLRLNLDRIKTDRGEVFKALRAENIGVNVHYIPVPWHPYYRDLGCQKGGWPQAEINYERMISLPMWAGMTAQDTDDVIDAVEKVIEFYRI